MDAASETAMPIETPHLLVTSHLRSSAFICGFAP
jgi:hypothetical protein